MSGWDFDANNGSGGGGDKINFTKFPQGVTKIRILDTEPHVRWTHWMPQYQRSINCPGRGCPIDEIRRQQKANREPYTYSMGKRLSMSVWNYETNQLEVMEQGVTFFQDLRDIMTDLREAGKSLQDVIIKVRRRGTTKDDTSYRVDIDSETPMDVVESDAIVSKPDLNEFFKPHTPQQILELINFTAGTRDEYVAKWNEVVSGVQEDENGEEEIEIR